MRRGSCWRVQSLVRLLSHLYAYGISIIPRSYDAIRTIIQPNKTTDAPTDGHGRVSYKSTILRAQQSTFISHTVKTTNGRLPDDGTFPMPQRRRSRIG